MIIIKIIMIILFILSIFATYLYWRFLWRWDRREKIETTIRKEGEQEEIQRILVIQPIDTYIFFSIALILLFSLGVFIGSFITDKIRDAFLLGILMPLLYVILLLNFDGFITIPASPRSRGIVVFFGVIQKVIFSHGFVILPLPQPLIQLLIFDVTVRRLVIRDKIKVKEDKEEKEKEIIPFVPSKDGVFVGLDTTVVFRIINPYALVHYVGEEEELIDLIRENTLSCIRNFVAGQTENYIRTNRERVEREILRILTERLETQIGQALARWGVEVTSVFVKDIKFSESFEKALEEQAFQKQRMKGVRERIKVKRDQLQRFINQGATFAQADLAYESENERVQRRSQDISLPNLGRIDLEAISEFIARIFGKKEQGGENK